MPQSPGKGGVKNKLIFLQNTTLLQNTLCRFTVDFKATIYYTVNKELSVYSRGD